MRASADLIPAVESCKTQLCKDHPWTVEAKAKCCGWAPVNNDPHSWWHIWPITWPIPRPITYQWMCKYFIWCDSDVMPLFSSLKVVVMRFAMSVFGLLMSSLICHSPNNGKHRLGGWAGKTQSVYSSDVLEVTLGHDSPPCSWICSWEAAAGAAGEPQWGTNA